MIFLIEPRLYYVIDFYDQPLTGLCIYKDQIYYFTLLDEDFYGMFELTEEDKQALLIEKQLFEQCVGRHWSYDWHSGKLEQNCYVQTGREKEFCDKCPLDYDVRIKNHKRYQEKMIGQFMEFEQWT